MYEVFLIVVSVDEAKPLIAAPACEGSFNLIGPAFLNVTDGPCSGQHCSRDEAKSMLPTS
jgi:hypothetical protein